MINLSANFRRFALVLAIAAITTATGCGGKKTKPDEGTTTSTAIDNTTTGDSDSGKAMGMQSIHFPYDAFTLTDEAKSTLNANAGILKGHGGVKIQIEGHCDQRGGIQYNIALGEKRANAAKKYLVSQGVGEDRITTISFGKERPVDTGTSEEAYAKNRRDNFVITSQ